MYRSAQSQFELIDLIDLGKSEMVPVCHACMQGSGEDVCYEIFYFV